jgi:hypothetical protein
VNVLDPRPELNAPSVSLEEMNRTLGETIRRQAEEIRRSGWKKTISADALSTQRSGWQKKEAPMNRTKRCGFLGLAWLASSLIIGSPAASGGGSGVPWTCESYNAAGDGEKAALTGGYLEGVQAALDKETRDMLVPPWYGDHPIWWVLPEGEVVAENLESSLSVFCRAKSHQNEKLIDAFFAVAARKRGAPAIGMSLGDGPSDRWRKIIADSTLTCAGYRAESNGERTHLIYGYSLGAKAMRVVLDTPREISLMVWPDADYREVKARVDAACGKEIYMNSTLPDVLWIVTAEMGTEKIDTDRRTAVRR